MVVACASLASSRSSAFLHSATPTRSPLPPHPAFRCSFPNYHNGSRFAPVRSVTHIFFGWVQTLVGLREKRKPVNKYRIMDADKLGNLIAHVQNPPSSVSVDQLETQVPTTGGAYDFKGATISVTNEVLTSSKRVTLVRHGLSSWNEENRVQGSSNLSILTDIGVRQAEKCRDALTNIKFDICFSSPITRAKSTAELIWHGREQPLVFLDSLKEAHLFFLEGMKNADAKKKYPELYYTWRQDPANFNVDGIYPIQRLWVTAREAWTEILSTPGESFLVITHKSILRALICTALGLAPERFRAIDINNGGISVFTFNKQGEAMLQSLNMTAHMYSDHTYQY